MIAKVITKNGTRFIPDARNKEGFLVQTNVGGVEKRLFYNQFLLEKHGYQAAQVQRDSSNLSLDEQIKKYADILIKWGVCQESGYSVTDAEEEKRLQLDNETGDTNIVNVYNWIFGYGIRERLPRQVWDKIKKFAEYHDGGEGDQEWADDMGYYDVSKHDLKGWAYSTEAIDILINEGLEVRFHNIKITSSAQISDILQKEREESEKHFKEVNERKAKANALYRRLLEFDCEYLTESDCKSLASRRLKETIIPDIGIEGHNIYGGGTYLLVDKDYIYVIKNNGHDGDDWSRNNYGTGGAGAIATRIKIDDAVTNWMIDVMQFVGDTNLFNEELKEEIYRDNLLKRYEDGLKDTGFRFDLFDLKTAKVGEKHIISPISSCFVRFGNFMFGYHYRFKRDSFVLQMNNDRDFLLFELSDEREEFFKSLLPEWFDKDVPGRFIIDRWLYFNLNQIDAGNNSIDLGKKNLFDEYVEGVAPVKFDNNTNIVVWNDGVITKNQFYSAHKPSCDTLDKDTAFYLSISHVGINGMEILEQEFKPRVKIYGDEPFKGFVYEIYRVETNSDKLYFLLDLTFYCPDDATTDYYLFRTENEARDCINNYLK